MFVCSFFNLKTVLGTHAHSTLSAHESDAGESDDDGDDGDGDDGGHEDGGGAAVEVGDTGMSMAGICLMAPQATIAACTILPMCRS